MDLPSLVTGAVVGAVGSGIVAPFLAPWGRKAGRAGQLISGENPVDVVIDTDQAVIWAGAPPWVGFSYYFPSGLPTGNPPETGFDWSEWAYKNRGIDVSITMFQLTVQARQNSTVVLDAPIVRILDRAPVDEGEVGTYGAGGADLNPRHFKVELDLFDPPVVEYLDEGFQTVRNPAFKLSAGDVERFQVWAYATGSDLIEWTLELPLIVNGKRHEIPISGPTDTSFRTLGRQHGLMEKVSYGQGWRPS